MPKRPTDSRPPFPGSLAKELLRVAHHRGRPETDLSPLLQALAREWIEQGSYRRRDEELEEITGRLAAVEEELRALTAAIVKSPSLSAAPKARAASADKLDNLTGRVLDHLVEMADRGGITPRLTAKEIAAKIARQGDQPTGKQITERIKKLLAIGVLSIEEDSGGRGGRRYHVELPSDHR